MGAVNIRLGTDGSGQDWFGITNGLITNSNGKAFPATGVGLQNAIDENVTTYLPDGTIILAASGVHYYSNTIIVGRGRDKTILDASGCTGDAISPHDASIHYEPQFVGFTLDGGNGSATTGINYTDTWDGVMSDVVVQYFNSGSGLKVDGGTVGASGLSANDCMFYNNSIGLNVTNSGVSFCTINSFIRCIFNNNIEAGVRIDQSAGAVANTDFSNCQIESNTGYGVFVATCQGTRLINCWLEGNSGNELYITSAGWDFLMVGGAVSFSTSTIQIANIAVGHGAVFRNVRGMYNTTIDSCADYIVFTDGTTYFLMNGSTGGVERTGNFVTVLNQAMINVGTDGGTVLLKRGTYTTTDILYVQKNTVLRGEGMDSTFISGKRMRLIYDSSGVEDLSLINSDAEGLTVDGSDYTRVWNVNISGYATVPVVFANGASNYSFINVKGVCQFNFPMYNESSGLAVANIPVGTCWFDASSNVLYVCNGSAWVSTTLT